MGEKIDQNSSHWIRPALDSLDPETDYQLMWRLMSCYHASDFANNFIYALTFPNFIITKQGSDVVWRNDGGKVVSRGTQRCEDTENYNMTWWFYGPSDQRCRDAVENINKLHTKLAVSYPGRFSYNEDYIYTLAFSVILAHRLKLRAGLSGYSEKEKIAAHHFWRDMANLFTREGGIPITGFPSDFNGCLAFCEEYENTPREYEEKARLIGLAIFNQFAYRYFPPGLRWFGRSMVISMSLPTTLRAMRIPPPNPIFQWVISHLFGLLMWFSETVLPDPKVALIERIRGLDDKGKEERKRNIGSLDAGFSGWIRPQVPVMGCPYHVKAE